MAENNRRVIEQTSQKGKENQFKLVNTIQLYDKESVIIESDIDQPPPFYLYWRIKNIRNTFSAKHKIFKSDGSLKWIYYNSFFRWKNSNIPEQDVTEIAQWIFDNIEFNFTDWS